MAPACSLDKMSQQVSTLTLICKNIHHIHYHNLDRRPTWGHELRGSCVVTEILSGKAAGQHAYLDPRAMLTPTMALAVSNGSCLAMRTGKVWSESTPEAFQRLCPTTTLSPPPLLATIEEAVWWGSFSDHPPGHCEPPTIHVRHLSGHTSTLIDSGDHWVAFERF